MCYERYYVPLNIVKLKNLKQFKFVKPLKKNAVTLPDNSDSNASLMIRSTFVEKEATGNMHFG